jgi:ankyrin repeat protein
MLSRYLTSILNARSSLRASSSDFPNFFSGIPHENSLAAIEKFIQLVIARIGVPHLHKGAVTNKHFFRHLAEYASKLAAESNSGIELDLYIGGGVVRSLLGYTYKHLHQQMNIEKDDEASHQAIQDQDKPFPNKLARYLTTILKSPEYHLIAPLVRENKPLLSPFVLGVGSDLDIYLEIISQNGAPLTHEQKEVGEKIRRALVNFINAVKDSAGLRDNKQAIKHSILPVADVKDYHTQMERTLGQGGSLLDTLAFRLTPKRSKDESWFKMPEGFQSTLSDFLDGYYEYLAPPKGQASHKQSVRGLRALLEIPFLDIKNSAVLSVELLNILNTVKQGQPINRQAIEQFQKMVRNANFEQAHNRAHLAPEGTPLNLGLQISDRVSPNDGSRLKRLMPSFLQKLKIDSPLVLKEGSLYSELSQHLMKKQDFIDNYTDKGLVYHGTSPEVGMSVLRGGFVESTNKQGAATYGPGAYVAKSHAEAAAYSMGLVLRLKISDANLNIIKQTDIQAHWQELKQEAQKKGFINQKQSDESEGVYGLLRDRSQYAIDIIIATNNTYLVVQNLNALVLASSLESMLAWLYSPLDKWVRGEPATTSELKKLDSHIKEYKDFYDLLKNIGADLSNALVPEDIYKTNIGMTVITDGHYKGHTALTFAIQWDRIDIAQSIISANPAVIKHVIPDGYDKGHTALTFAIEKGHIGIAQSIMAVNPAAIHHVIPDGYAKGHTALTRAIVMGRIDIAKLIMAANPEAINHVITDGYYKGYTVLTLEIAWGCIDIAQSIIAANPEAINHVIPDDDYKGHTALTFAIKMGNIDIVQLIIEANPAAIHHVISDGDDKGHTPLTLAIEKGHIGIAQSIMAANPEAIHHVVTDGYDKGHTVLTFAIQMGRIDIAKSIMAANPEAIHHVVTDGYAKGHTALTRAIEKGHIDIAQSIMAVNPAAIHHVIPDGYSKGHTVLTFAIIMKCIDIAQSIMATNPAAIHHVISDGYSKGHTALTFAIQWDRIDIAQSIMAANPAAINHVIPDGDHKGHTALTLAIEMDHIDIAQSIMAANPEAINHVIPDGDHKGHTALTLAIEMDHIDIAQSIIKANPEAIHHVVADGYAKGHTALTIARSEKQTEIVELIEALESAPEVARGPSEAQSNNNNMLIFSSNLKPGIKRKNDDATALDADDAHKKIKFG